MAARPARAAIVAAVPGIALEVDERWSETDFGIAEGLTFDELVGVAPDIAARMAEGHVDIDWPGGEPAALFAARVETAWRDLIGRGTPALIVSHGGPLRIAIARASKRDVGDVTLPEPGSVWRLPIRTLTPITPDT